MKLPFVDAKNEFTRAQHFARCILLCSKYNNNSMSSVLMMIKFLSFAPTTFIMYHKMQSAVSGALFKSSRIVATHCNKVLHSQKTILQPNMYICMHIMVFPGIKIGIGYNNKFESMRFNLGVAGILRQ